MLFLAGAAVFDFEEGGSCGDGGDAISCGGVGEGADLRDPACRMADCCVLCLRSLLMRPPPAAPLLLLDGRARDEGFGADDEAEAAGRAVATSSSSSLESLSLSVASGSAAEA